MKASAQGYLEIVKYLVGIGANVNATNNVGETALIWASAQGNLELVKYLVVKGANVNAKNRDGDTSTTESKL